MNPVRHSESGCGVVVANILVVIICVGCTVFIGWIEPILDILAQLGR